MKKSDLEKLGLTAEAIEKAGLAEDLHEQLFKLHGKSIESAKAEVLAANEKAEGFEKQLAEANKAIDGFKKLDADGLSKAVDEWQKKASEYEAAAKKAAEDADAKVSALKFDYALDGALRDAKAKNPVAVKALLKLDDLKLGEDGIVGLSEQLEKVKADNDYLFSDGESPAAIVAGGKSAKTSDDAVLSAMRAGAGLTKPGE